MTAPGSVVASPRAALAVFVAGLAMAAAPLARSSAGVRPLKVLAFNVQMLPGPLRVLNDRPDADYRARTIGRCLGSYDVVGLCELFDERARCLLTAPLRAAWGASLFELYSPRPGRLIGTHGGLAILSRLTPAAFHRLTFVAADRALISDRLAAKGALHARLLREPSRAGDFIDVFVTHLESRHVATRWAQVAELAAFVSAHRSPRQACLILGDFNVDGRREADYRRLLDELSAACAGAELVDLGRSAGGTKDQRSRDGGKRIDYVFLATPSAGAPLAPQRARVRRFLDPRVGSLSDHSAVETRLAWRTDANPAGSLVSHSPDHFGPAAPRRGERTGSTR